MAQAVDATEEPFLLPKFSENEFAISLDGKLDEAIWSKVPAYDDMVVIDPDTLTRGQFETHSRFFYTDKGLYVGIFSQQDTDTLVARLSSRDQFVNRDGFDITVDTSGEGLYGYQFGLNLGGTLMDSTVLPERQFNKEWDGPWDGATAQTDEGWSGEMFLPWSMMTMPYRADSRRMGFYVSRRVAYLDERWSWPALPRTKSAFLSALQPFQLHDINPKMQFTFYPFGSSTYDNIKKETEYKTGFDIYWRPFANLQFTTTINPDFGNVESDDVVVNLTSFETFYPEKRPFFLEGNEIFVTTPRAEVRRSSSRRFRGEPTTLLNTRRIGGAPRNPDLPEDVDISDLELSQPTELLGAFKVTGQQGKVRYGVLAAIEDDIKFEATRNGLGYPAKQDGRDFGVARIIYEDTTGGGRRAVGWMSTLVSHQQHDAVVHSMDAHYLSPNKKWLWDLQLMRSDVAEKIGAGGFVDAKFIPRRGITHAVSFDYLDDQLDINDLGFIRRNDSINFRYSYSRNESNFARLKNRRLSWFLSQEYNTDGRAVRSGLFTSTSWTFANNTRWSTLLSYFPGRWDDRNSDGNGSFRIKDRWVLGIGWSSDSAKKISVSLDAGTQQEELHGWSNDASVKVTWRPNDRFSLLADIKYLNRNQWLLHWAARNFTTYKAEVWQPLIEMDLFLTAKQQFRFTAQWAGFKAFQHAFFEVPLKEGDLVPVPIAPGSFNRDFSISRLTFQARYRWEIAPLSDLFVVYTRGSNLPSTPGEDFSNLLRDAWKDKIVDIFVVKLRYRLGS